MTARFRQKKRKWRGRTSHGWGMKKKHRGGGSLGGRGFSGRHKHKFSFVTSKDPDYYGYKGFFSRNRKERTININDIAKMKDGEINLAKLGYDKLLGRGRIDHAVVVRVKKFSEKAKEKIEKAGGKIET